MRTLSQLITPSVARGTTGAALGALAAAVLAAAALAACSIEAVTFTPVEDPRYEDCSAEGDEDGNGVADCDDPACESSIACAPATCTDGAKNGDETDVDCGGSCPPCGDAAACLEDRDCDSGLCGAATCARHASCREILDAGHAAGDGDYHIDLDGPGGAPPFPVRCDMTIDGGGWTRFHWIRGDYPAGADPFEQQLRDCDLDAAMCRGRIPATATPTHFMVKDLGDGDVALWQFDPANAISNAVLGALRDKLITCTVATAWNPYQYTGTETFCGHNVAGGCDAFVYVDTSFPGCQQYTGWYTQLDDDTGCYNTAFKLGMPHTGYETIGCERPESNYLDDGPSTLDDREGELYYR